MNEREGMPIAAVAVAVPVGGPGGGSAVAPPRPE